MNGKVNIFSSMEEACAFVGIAPKPVHEGFVVTSTVGENISPTAGRIRIFSDGKGGIAFNWRDGTRAVFFYGYDKTKPISDAEIARMHAEAMERAKEEEARQEETNRCASELARTLVEHSRPATSEHPYLRTKHVAFASKCLRSVDKHEAQRLINASNVKPAQMVLNLVGNDLLLLPLVGSDGAVASVQFIDSKGNKKFLKGGRMKGACWIGVLENIDTAYEGEIALCEGMATAVSVSKVQRIPAVAGMNSGNLLDAVGTVTKMYPRARISIFADRDEGEAGLNGAKRAIKFFPKVSIYLPVFTGEEIESFQAKTGSNKYPTDYNDFYIARGIL